MKYIVKVIYVVAFLGLFSSLGIAQEGKASSQIDNMLDGFLGGDLSSGIGAEVTPEQLAAVDEKIFRYIYDESVSAEVRGLWATAMTQNGITQAQADEQAAIFTPEFNQQWVDETFVNTGFQANDIADVMAMEIILNMVIAQQLANGTPYQGDVAVRDMFKVSSATTNEFKAFSDREKQFYAESTILKIMISIGDYVYKLQNNESVQKQVEKAHNDLLRFGLDSRMVMITETGIGFTHLLDAVVNDTMTMEEAFPKEFVFDPTGAAPIPSKLLDSNSDTKTSTETSAETSTEITQLSQTSSIDSNPLSQTQTTTNPLAVLKEVSPFVGSFKGEGLVLTLVEAGEGFAGELNFNGQVFPVEATGTTPNLTGSFGDGSSSFPFTATLIADTLNFDSQGNVFTLEKEIVNPLGN